MKNLTATIIFIAIATAMAMTIFPAPLRATQPCQNPAPNAFAEIVRSAPVIIHGRIVSQDRAAGQTNVQIVETLKGETPGNSPEDAPENSPKDGQKNSPETTIAISGWLHDDPPLFIYREGAESIFLLTALPDGKFALTDLSWADCTPALIDRLPDGRFMTNGAPMDIETFKKTYFSPALLPAESP